MQKIGNGTLNLNGANTYSGITAINGGTLHLNGSVIGNVIIGSGGKLSGNAAVNGNLNNSAIDSVVHVDINSNNPSLITVGGIVSLTGILEINLDPNTSPGQYTLLNSSGISGSFHSVRFTGATPLYSISYLPAGAPTLVQFNFLGYPSIPATVNGSPIWSPAVVCCGRPVLLGPLPVPGSGPTVYTITHQTGYVTCQIKQTNTQTYLKMYGNNGSCTIIGTKEGVVSNPLKVIAP